MPLMIQSQGALFAHEIVDIQVDGNWKILRSKKNRKKREVITLSVTEIRREILQNDCEFVYRIRIRSVCSF